MGKCHPELDSGSKIHQFSKTTVSALIHSFQTNPNPKCPLQFPQKTLSQNLISKA
jgi:hypothetical protein